MSDNRYSPAEAARLRAACIEERCVPAVRRAFEAHPPLQSAVMLVGQYWCDEALDAVHLEMLFSQLPTPDVAAANAARKQAYEAEAGVDVQASRENSWHRWFPWWRPKPASNSAPSPRERPAEVNLPAQLDQEELGRAYVWEIPWDSNDEAIPLFAAFCLEDCHQEMEPGEAYSPYAIFRRRGAQIDVEIVGVMHRPWLDGVNPEGMEGEE